MIGLKCSVEGCGKDAKTRGLCWTHDFSQRYQRDPKFRENRNKTKRDYNRRLLQTYRDVIAEGLGGWKCVICAVADRDVLSFDHKDGGGENERNRMGGQLPTIRYYYHNPAKAKERLQVLCANCNWKKNAPKYGQGRSRTAVWQRTARVALIDLLGGRTCGVCGMKDVEVLTIDHVNGGGTRERKTMKGYPPMIWYYSAHHEAARRNLQVLCRNCNWKRYLSRSRNA
jgi:hypothetical protein